MEGFISHAEIMEGVILLKSMVLKGSNRMLTC